MTSLLIQNARVLAPGPDAVVESEAATADFGALPLANVLIEDGKIVEVSETKNV